MFKLSKSMVEKPTEVTLNLVDNSFFIAIKYSAKLLKFCNWKKFVLTLFIHHELELEVSNIRISTADKILWISQIFRACLFTLILSFHRTPWDLQMDGYALKIYTVAKWNYSTCIFKLRNFVFFQTSSFGDSNFRPATKESLKNLDFTRRNCSLI